MTRQILFIQGGGEAVHDQWDDKLVASLRAELGADYEVRYPLMPNEDDPSYAAWATAIRSELAALDEGAVLVGHSVGATFLVHAIAERPPEREPAAILLISAPFVGPGGWETDEWTPQRALGDNLPRRVAVHLFYGLDDDTVPASHAEAYARAIPRAELRRLPGRDHQLNNDLSEVADVIGSVRSRH
jgi:predicted alpha/beta hydrolase family esterase